MSSERAFLHQLFPSAYLSTPLFICYGGNKVRGKYEMLPFEFPFLLATLKTTLFDAHVFCTKMRGQHKDVWVSGNSVDYWTENVDAYLRPLLDRMSWHMWQLVKHARGQDWRSPAHSEDFDLQLHKQSQCQGNAIVLGAKPARGG